MIITVVGAGGKTTICTRLGWEFSRLGFTVLFTTTTHIRRPGGMPVFIGNARDIALQSPFMAASADTGDGKLKGFDPADIDAIESRQVFDIILVEGDGAKERPVKAPAEWEPVYPAKTMLTIGVIGLDCLGKPITEKFVHRPGLFCAVTGANPGDPITYNHLLALIQNPLGLFRHAPADAKQIVFLNKRDLIAGNGEQVSQLMRQTDIPVFLTGRDSGWPDKFISGYMPGWKAKV